MDDRCNSDLNVDFGTGLILHHGGINSRSIDNRRRGHPP